MHAGPRARASQAVLRARAAARQTAARGWQQSVILLSDDLSALPPRAEAEPWEASDGFVTSDGFVKGAAMSSREYLRPASDRIRGRVMRRRTTIIYARTLTTAPALPSILAFLALTDRVGASGPERHPSAPPCMRLTIRSLSSPPRGPASWLRSGSRLGPHCELAGQSWMSGGPCPTRSCSSQRSA
jgi:hypothetical protein